MNDGRCIIESNAVYFSVYSVHLFIPMNKSLVACNTSTCNITVVDFPSWSAVCYSYLSNNKNV